MKEKILYYKITKCKNKNKKIIHPVILIRGLGRSIEFWLNFETELSQYCDIVFIDLLGTGKSKNFFGRSSISNYSKDVIYTMSKIHLTQFHLTGISLGGMVCMEIAKNQNENILISSLCVMSSSSSGMNLKRINTVPLFLILISFLNALFVGYPKNKLFAHYLVHPETLKNQKNLISIWDTIAKTRKISFISLLNQLIAAGTYHFKLNKNKITCPTLFLVSKNDLLVPWTNSVALWHTVPMSQLQVFEGLGHDLSTDQPALIAKTLSHFFYTQEQAQINKA